MTVAFAAAAMCFALPSCNKLTPSGGSATMLLLREGSAKACVAADVKKAFRGVIMPTVSAVGSPSSAEDVIASIENVAVTFEQTSLQSFDKSVAKVVCNSTVTIADDQGSSRKFGIDYVIAPSADVPNGFIITAQADDAREYAIELVRRDIVLVERVRQAEIDGAEADAEAARVRATITPKWMIGTWISEDDELSTCAGSGALALGADHVFERSGVRGRWTLNGDELHLIGSGVGGNTNETRQIVDADAISFSSSDYQGERLTYRRCAPDELASPLPATDPTAVQMGGEQ